MVLVAVICATAVTVTAGRVTGVTVNNVRGGTVGGMNGVGVGAMLAAVMFATTNVETKRAANRTTMTPTARSVPRPEFTVGRLAIGLSQESKQDQMVPRVKFHVTSTITCSQTDSNSKPIGTASLPWSKLSFGTGGRSALHLQSLRLSGFKTFAVPTVVEFAEGITAVVGANGSGKSNLVDAVKWALGEQSARDLRTKRTEDLIFSGSQSRRPAAMAEVVLQFGNETGWLPVEATEVELTRRVYRSTESEYLINSQRVRLREIVDVVRVGGLTAGGHTIVGQGMVDAVLSLRGVDRRGFIAAVAGVAPYESRRDEAIRRLDQTRENVAAAQIVYEEMEPRLRLLRRQANIVQNAQKARVDLTDALVWHYHLAWRALSDERASSGEALARARESLEILRQEIGKFERDQATLQGRLDAVRQARESRRELILATEYQLKRAQDAEANSLAALKQAESEQPELGRRLEVLTSTIPSKAEIAQIGSQIENLQSRRGEMLIGLQSNQALQAQCRKDRDTLAQTRVAGLEGVRERREALSQREEQARKLRREAEIAAGRRSEVKETLPVLQRAIEEAREALQSAKETEIEAEARLLASSEVVEQCAVHSANNRKCLVEVASTIDSLTREERSLSEERDELARGRPPDDSGRSVAEAVSVPAELALALAAAVGDLADSPAAPHSDGRGPREAPAHTAEWQTEVVSRLRADGIEVIGWLRDQAALADSSVMVSSLLDATLVLSNPNEMERAWSVLGDLGAMSVAHPPLRLVDPEGNIRDARSLDSAPPEARRSVRREMAIIATEERLQKVIEVLSRAQPEYEEIVKTEKLLADALTAAEREFRDANIAAVSVRTETVRSADALKQLEADTENRNSLLAELDRTCQSIQAELESIDAAMLGLKAALIEAETHASTIDERLVAQAGKIHDLEDSGRRQHADLQLLDRQLELELGEQERIRRLGEAGERERESIIVRREVVESNRKVALEALLVAREDLKAIEVELAQTRIAAESAPEVPTQQETAELTGKLRRLRREAEAAVGELERKRSHIEQLDERAARLIADCQLDLETHPSELNPQTPRLELTDVEIRRLRIRAEQAEDVEPGAEDEYRDLATRRESLAEQIEDLRVASEELLKMLGDADREVRRRFRITFAQVQSLFGEYFRDIFGGGAGELVCETVDDIDAVEIIAQLPGKRARDLGGLSGGERTLVAGAFLFSLLAADPPPFCILDEVDAALDESNVDRYLGVLRDLAQQTQFVVVTHNRGSMAAADTLYGIVLDPDIGSRALSLRLDQALAG